MAADLHITQILKTAHESVAAANVPEDFRVSAFERAVDLLAASAGLVVIPPTPTPQPDGAASSDPKPSSNPGDAKTLARVAAKLKLPDGVVAEVFHIEDDKPTLVVGTGKLASADKTATEQIALLIAAARQAGGWDADDWTSVNEIRSVTQAYGKLDSANFAKHIKGMDEVFGFNGNGANRKVRVNRKGFESAAALVKLLAGEE